MPHEDHIPFEPDPDPEMNQAAPKQLSNGPAAGMAVSILRGQPLTKEQTLEAARIYTTQVIHETEKALVSEIEKMDGRVPSGVELTQYGRHVFHKEDLSSDYFYKGIHLVSVKPHQVDETTGRLGTRIIVHQQPDKTLEERDWTE